MDIHNYKGRFERALQRLEKSDISKKDKEAIYKFKDYCLCQNISYGKIDTYLFYLVKFTKMLDKPIEKATKEDIMRVVAKLNQTGLSEQTKKCFKIALRRLYKILRGVDGKGEYPEEVKWISINIRNNHKKLPEELLTESEIEELIRNAENIRDKALLSTLAESGCRVSEIGLMKIKHISFEEYGARLTVSGKTGTRKILIINSTPYLQEWVNQHPKNNDSDSYLWYNPRNKSLLSYTGIVSILKKAARRAGITKRIYPHLLRHTRATHLAHEMSDATMKQYFGWGQGSQMASIYIHMSGKDTDDAILKANGIEITKEKKESKLKPITCLRCKTVNSMTSKFCKLCGFVLNETEAKVIVQKECEKEKMDTVLDKLFKDKAVLKVLADRIKQCGIIQN